MIDEELVSRIQTEITDALGYNDDISKQREQAMEYYYARPFGNEVEGRSQFVDSTVADTIEWIKPSLMRVFASGDNMVSFSPVGPEDVDASDQASQYINHIFTKDNSGWEILYTWFSDALLQKNGIVKVWWDETDENDREEYQNLTELELDALLASEEIEVVEHTRNDDFTNDVVVTRNIKDGRVTIENVPPEEFLISREAKSIKDSRFVCHRVKKTLTELKEMGFDVDPDELSSGDDEMGSLSGERQARFDFDSSINFGLTETEAEEALKEYWLYESYLKTDWDNDGLAELRKVCSIGDKILANDPVDRVPFISITPIKVPHKFFGLSVADLIMDLQLIKSTLMRNLMDNMYNQNFGRFAVLEGQANLDDLLTQRPGGLVRVKSPNAVMPLSTPPLEPYTFQMLEYLDSVRESRAGVNKYSQGLNDKALTSHTTASAVNSVMTAAQSRVELIARNLAETGVKDLMLAIYELVQKNQNKERVVLLRNQWIEIRPDMWRDKMDCTVSVGLGHGNKDQQLMHLSSMLQFAAQAMQGGLRIVNEQNMYNIGAALIRNMGFQNVDDFLTDPSQIQPSGPSPEEQMQQMEMQNKQKELEIKSAEVQIKAQKVQQDAAEAQMDAQLKIAELGLEAKQNRPVALG